VVVTFPPWRATKLSGDCIRIFDLGEDAPTSARSARGGRDREPSPVVGLELTPNVLPRFEPIEDAREGRAAVAKRPS
jgi:hypothetical protein